MTKNVLFNKQIILAVGMIVFVVAAVIGGTGAFFSDTESSTGNVFTAGSVSLEITDIAHDYSGDPTNQPSFEPDEDGFSFELDDIKPLDNGTVTYNLENGANEAHICVLVENATVAPEANDTALASMLNFLIGEESGIAGVWQSLDTLDAEETADFGIDYCFGVYDDGSCVLDDVDYNPAQNGQMVVDIDFYAVQTRNNPDFDCASLNPIEYVYNQGFEETLVDWQGLSGGVLALAADGTNGVPSADGDFHANVTGQAFTRWGGYSNTFPVGGYTTEVDVYLDMALATGVDTRFDFSSAINTADVSPTHRRDFIFHLGTDPLNPGQWRANASNNAPGNPGGAGSVSITTTGWYTLQAYFYDAGAGVLAVDLNIVDSNGVVVGTWTRSDASDIIGVTVGGNRYGWFVNNAFTPLSFDNAQLYLGAPIN